MNKNTYQVELTYEPVGGFASIVFIDWNKLMAEEETYFSIKNVIPF